MKETAMATPHKTVFYIIHNKKHCPPMYIKFPTAETTTFSVFEAYRYPEEFKERACEDAGRLGKNWTTIKMEVTLK